MTFSSAKLLCATALIAVLSSCSSNTNPATGRTEYTTISSAEEAKLGAEEHPKILESFGGAYTENGIDQYVNSIGQKLAANSELAGQTFTFTVLDDPIVNAFALPGGYVYVTRGLLALTENEAQLAGVLGHEIGHVTGRHAAQRNTRSTLAGIGSLAATIGAVALGADPNLAKQIGQVSQVAAKGSVATFSREQELEADRLGVRYLSRAGYDPFAQSRFLRSMRAQEALSSQLSGKQADDPNKVSFFSTHPATGARVDEAVKAAQASGIPINSGAPLNRDQYLRNIDNMIYGDNTKDGFIRGQTFTHVPLNFGLAAPADYKIINTQKAVGFQHRTNKNVRAIFTSGKRETSDMLALVRKGAKMSSGGERITINGMPAATIAKNTNNGKRARLVAIDAGDTIYKFIFSAPQNTARQYEDDFRSIANSFHRLSAAERANTRAYRLRMHRVGYGETVESLAARTPFDDLKVERFRVLNGLQPGEQVQPGQVVKVVQ